MVLGDKEHVLYGKGSIEDELCGCKFRISPKSFYQVNPVQTEYLYGKPSNWGLRATSASGCLIAGIGTIGIIAASKVKEVIGVELNADAVRDAVQNAKCNDVKISALRQRRHRIMMQMAASGDTVDVVLMDPPRAGSTEAFIKAVAAGKQNRDLRVLRTGHAIFKKTTKQTTKKIGEFSLEDMDMSEFQDGATYPQIKEYVLSIPG